MERFNATSCGAAHQVHYTHEGQRSALSTVSIGTTFAA